MRNLAFYTFLVPVRLDSSVLGDKEKSMAGITDDMSEEEQMRAFLNKLLETGLTYVNEYALLGRPLDDVSVEVDKSSSLDEKTGTVLRVVDGKEQNDA